MLKRISTFKNHWFVEWFPLEVQRLANVGPRDGSHEPNDALYLDVYVDGSGNIYGYVLFTNNASIDGSIDEDAAATAAAR